MASVLRTADDGGNTARRHGNSPGTATMAPNDELCRRLLSGCSWLSGSDAINTVFLPRRLQSDDRLETDDEEEETDDSDDSTLERTGAARSAAAGMFARINEQIRTGFARSAAVEVFARINEQILPRNIIGMLKKWNTFRHADANLLKTSLCELDVDDAMPVHLSKHNTVLVFAKLSADVIVVRAYHVQPPKQAVTTCPSGKPLTVAVPQSSLCVPLNVVTSDTVLKQLAALQRHNFAHLRSKSRAARDDDDDDVPSPRFVFEWLLGVLDALGSADTVTQAVTKKIRDRVEFSSTSCSEGDEVWRRRNADWLAFKSVLHSTLVCCHGVQNGTLLYKTAMLRFMFVFTRHPLCQQNNSDDLLQQVLCKISRRIAKLDALLDSTPGTEFTHHVLDTLQALTEGVEELNRKALTSWSDEVKAHEQQRVARLSPSCCPCEDDTHLPLKASASKLALMLDGAKKLGDGSFEWRRGSIRRDENGDRTMLSTLEEEDHCVTHAQANYIIRDFENDVFDRWERRQEVPIDLEKVRCDLKTYRNVLVGTNKAISRTVCDSPERVSRALLTGAVLAALCDMHVTEIYPDLTDHLTDVREDLLDAILVPDKRQLNILAQVQAYFRKRRRNARFRSGPLEYNHARYETYQPCSVSLSVRFAQHSSAMTTQLQEVDAAEQKRQKEHEGVITEQLRKMEADERLLESMEHTYTWRKNVRGEPTKVHDPACRACELGAHMEKRTESVYISRLPTRPHQQRAAIFEACIPSKIAQWRDTIYYYENLMIRLVCGHDAERFQQRSCKCCWRSFIKPGPALDLQLFMTSSGHDSHSDAYSVCLGSTRGIKHQSLPLRYQKVDDFVKPCTLNQVMCVDGIRIDKVDVSFEDVQRCCSRRTETASLQTFVTGTRHQQSEVIALQSQCPASFSHNEFVAFGSLRAGERLQWHNILRGIHQRTLVLHNADTYTLLQQAVWQAGSAQFGSSLRAAHQPCIDTGFVREMVSELNAVLDSVADSWQHDLTLGSVVLLANRMYDIYRDWDSADVVQVAHLQAVLQRCRHLAMRWIRQVKEILYADSGDARQTAADNATLPAKIARIARYGLLTYVHAVKLDDDEESLPLYIWLYLSTVYCENVADHRKDSVAEFLSNIVLDRHDDFVRVIESGLEESDECGMPFDELDSFVGEVFAPGEACRYELRAESMLWLIVGWKVQDITESVIDINLRTGQLFVDGKPQGSLPDGIRKHSTYKRHFGSSGVHGCVKPFPSPRGESGYITEKTNGRQFVFAQVKSGTSRTRRRLDLRRWLERHVAEDFHSDSDDEIDPMPPVSWMHCATQLHVYEITGRQQLQLIPADWFKTNDTYDFQLSLLDTYSVWLDRRGLSLLFRPMLVKDFTNDVHCLDVAFELDLLSRKLNPADPCPPGIPVGVTLLDNQCALAEQLISVLSPLQREEYMELWLKADQDVLVRMPQLGLSFNYAISGGESRLESVEHRGWLVDTDQAIGTLLGLRNYLVLTECKHERSAGAEKKRCIIVPHGAGMRRGRQHYLDTSLVVPVLIDSDALRKPPFFRYELNASLRQLTGPFDRAAWLFLALLHAVTSTTNPDPFTGLTGLEAALNILQSARCWSCRPYDDSTRKLLQDVRRLSPKRSPYPGRNFIGQTVQWPPGLSSYSASDAYAIQVDRLLKHSKQLSFLFDSTHSASQSSEKQDSRSGQSEKCSPELFLSCQAYSLHCAGYPLMAQLQDHPQNVTCPVSAAACSTVASCFPASCSQLSRVQQVASMIATRRCVLECIPSYDVLHKSLLSLGKLSSATAATATGTAEIPRAAASTGTAETTRAAAESVATPRAAASGATPRAAAASVATPTAAASADTGTGVALHASKCTIRLQQGTALKHASVSYC
eukprot:scpid7885/ scgid19127/ 